MKTTGIMLQTLIVPCSCRCRYCLLSWDGNCIGADYQRSEAVAKRFHDWIKEYRPELSFNFCFGYSMDHPQLIRAIDFMNSIGSVSGRFLQMNGFAFRSPEAQERLMHELAAHGVEAMNFTFYGTEATHDRFAGRAGDYRFLLSMATAAIRAGIRVSAGILLTTENIRQTDELVSVLKDVGLAETRLFIPHEEGRGCLCSDIRCSEKEIELLKSDTEKLLNRRLYRTEAEWIQAGDVLPETKRSLLISLTKENIDRAEQTDFAELIRQVEALDDAYYSAVPGFPELLDRYGDPDGTKLYGKRDLYQHYQKRYLKESGICVTDVTDERFSGTRRF